MEKKKEKKKLEKLYILKKKRRPKSNLLIFQIRWKGLVGYFFF